MRAFKICLCMLLVFSLCVLPTMQRVHAVVTVTTVVGVLILTVLAAMGITLVVKDMQKEAFVLQKGDSFMQSKGYSGSFAEWVAGGTDVDVALKTGFLVLAKPVVDRIKEFVAWLLPSAASDTVIDITSGAVLDAAYMAFGSVPTDGNVFVPSAIGSLSSSYPFTLTDGIITLKVNGGNSDANGYYNSVTGELVMQRYDTGGRDPYTVLVVEDGFTYAGTRYLPGVYLGLPLSGGRYSIIWGRYYFPVSAVDGGQLEASAVIGSYDDLSHLQDSTSSDGTVNNTFYITQDGQALNPSSDDIADIIGALQQSLDDINRKLDVMPWTAEAAEAGTVTPDYSDFQLGDLDFSTLGALITTRFPFSIPWDLVRIFQLFNAEPVAPHWEVDLLPLDAFAGVDTTIELDLGDYPLVGQVSRWFCIIDLCLGLVFVSKKLIWTA